MSLIFIEGFEHFHETAKNLSMPGGGHLGPKYLSWRHAIPTTASAAELALLGNHNDTHYFNTSFSHNNVSVRQGMVNEHVEVGRKKGKSLSIEGESVVTSVGSANRGGCINLTFKVKKSRTLFIGFALRLDIPRHPETGNLPAHPRIIVNLGRSVKRRAIQDGISFDPAEDILPTGGCCWQERGNYADLVWAFQDQESIFTQLTHNRDITDGDWHYFQFGTTLLGNQAEAHESTAWVHGEVAGISDVHNNIRTATPGTQEESFFDTINLRVYVPYHSSGGYKFRAFFDDIYVCNDEGEVNSNFLGNCYVRKMRPTFTGLLSDAYSVGSVYRHEAVGPEFVGDETEMPDPPPAPEEDPDFYEWANPGESHLVLPREENRQNFHTSAVSFFGSTPRIIGVTADVVAQLAAPNVARGCLIPIKTMGGASHTYFPVSSDMLQHYASIQQLIFENPSAQLELYEQPLEWRHDGVNNSDYGFRLDPVIDVEPYNKDWNPALLRYPLTHEHTVDEGLGLESWSHRFWEEWISDEFDIEGYNRWDWACPIKEEFMVFDESDRVRTSNLYAWSPVWLRDEIVMPEEYVRDSLNFSSQEYLSLGATLRDEFESYDTSYHEWVEQLTSWMDPYDFAGRAWVQTISDEIAFSITDIFDNHFEIAELLKIFDYPSTNQFFVGENLGFQEYTQHGVVLSSFDGFHIEEDHHNGWWVEQLPEQINYECDILTRVFRFYIFFGVCMSWWHIGEWEQPLEWWEKDPCQDWNDRNMLSRYKELIGWDEYFEGVEISVQEKWIELGGDPEKLEDPHARWLDARNYILDGLGNLIDLVDENGISIFGEFPDGEG